MMNFLKTLLGGETVSVDFKELLANGAIIVDVRTPGEFKAGHIKGAINIPVDVIGGQAASLKKKGVPVITCCRSGARSGAAANILSAAGIEAFNGGPWDSLQERL